MDSQFYNDYSLPSEFCGYPTPAVVTGCSPGMGGAMWGTNSREENLVPIFCDNNGTASFDIVSPESDISSCAVGVATTFPELLGFSEDAVAPVSFSEYSHLGLNGIAGLNQNFGGGDSYLQLYNKGNIMRDQFGDQECCTGFIPADSKPLGLAVQENWGFNQGNQVPTMEDQSTNMKVGRYSEEERKERIERYLKKRNQRNFNKTIKYACRKTLADRRVRVRGRFARNSSNEQLINEDLTHQEMATKKIDANCNNHVCNDISEQLYCSSGAVQIKYDEEDWLQEAMASLVYLPYVTAG
ncbi:putative transcription factor C2C2-CO-like family [Rosa chinensis]|uniref:Putative transcription factor C2C2-CO-like family n=1 Tax=Rosa chinensis TaxID=74649 RepID=A0A2P6Q8U2_ROSCH|nr:zinc finger protein CONSTANS [Rosa chinensis]PRQ30577.1 putative transcription factor C2C2-CO-like family [Rosa chinensis]